jgi:hypothetical protein
VVDEGDLGERFAHGVAHASARERMRHGESSSAESG